MLPNVGDSWGDTIVLFLKPSVIQWRHWTNVIRRLIKKAMPWRLFARKMHKIHHAETRFRNISHQNHSRNQLNRGPIPSAQSRPWTTRRRRPACSGGRATASGPKASHEAPPSQGRPQWSLGCCGRLASWKNDEKRPPLSSPSRPPTKIIGGSEL